MRDRLLSVSGAEVELIEGDGGVFEITRDGDLVFSKKKLNRVPEDQEIDSIIAAG